MLPGGCLFRRRLRTTAVAIVAALVLLTPFAGSPAQASKPARSVRAGEPGTGMPAIPVVYPRTRTLAGHSIRTATAVTFADLGMSDAWAKEGIVWVAKTNSWMLDFAPNTDGTYDFRPDAIERRKYFARSVVRAFAPDEAPDPSIVFDDLDASSPWYRYAAVAADHGWLTEANGAFDPDGAVTMAMVHRALVLALGLAPAAKALNGIHTRDGVTFKTPSTFGTNVLGMRLGLRYNAPTGSESHDVAPKDRMPRAQVAYSLWRATTQPSWNVPNLLTQYANVELPHLGPRAKEIVRWGIRYAGYPYVWGGEWGLETKEPSALGGQPRSGFDCSGLTWWLLRADDGGYWNVNPPRPYLGWSLPQRTSADMAAMASKRLRYDDLHPGDPMFYDGDGNGTVDHVDTFIGRGWALDSSSTPGGVTIMWVGSGWYRDHFKWGRRVLPG
jgi:cell wall-associated NlpC family hydrolase